MAAYRMPTDPEERECWNRDPEAYEVIERLHDAVEQLIAAVDEQVNATGVLFSAMHEPYRTALAEKGAALPTPERLLAARQEVERAQAQWAAAVTRADELLHQRQEGGE